MGTAKPNFQKRTQAFIQAAHDLLNRFMLFILPLIARLHPSNWRENRWRYPQTWWLMPKRWIEVEGEYYPNGQNKLRRAKLRPVLEKICGFLTGHEISNTEYGYGGGKMMDRNCRWCDKFLRIPLEENIPSKKMKDLMTMLKDPPDSSPLIEENDDG